MTNGEDYFEILEDFDLSRSDLVKQRIDLKDDAELMQFFETLLTFYQKNFSIVLKKLQNSDDAFNIYPMHVFSPLKVKFLKQISLYAEKIVVRDPIFETFYNSAYSQINFDAIRSNLKSWIPSVLATKSLIENNILYFIPTYMQDKIIYEKTKVSISNDLKNREFHDIVLNNLRYKVYPESNVLMFLYDNPEDWHFFRYGRIIGRVKKTEEASYYRIVFPNSLNEEIKEEFNITDKDISNWINSERNNEIIRIAEKINKDLIISDVLNSNIVTDVNIYGEILNWKSMQKNYNIINNILNIDLPFLEGLSIDDIVEIRKDENNTFHEFRLNLKKISTELENSRLDINIEKKSKIIKRDYIDPEIDKLEKEIKNIKKYHMIKATPRIVGAIATLSASILLKNPLLSIISSPVIIKYIKEFSDEYAEYFKEKIKLKNNKMYFLWKLKSTAHKIEKNNVMTDFPENVSINGEEMAKKIKGLSITFPSNSYKIKDNDNEKKE